MKRLIYRLLLRNMAIAAVLAMCALQANATHIMGMNISYKHISGDSFEIVMDFWRYCGGSAFDNGTATYASTGTFSSYRLYCPDQGFITPNMSGALDTVIDVSPICEAQSYLNSCPPNGTWQTGLLGIEWYIYRDTLDFSTLAVSSCSEWLVTYQTGARNTGTNYVSQPSIVAYDKFRMDDYPTNSSPLFSTAKPIPFFCNGQEVTYNWGAIELDGDSLWWELDTAWSSWNSTSGFDDIDYQGGYSGPEPMPGITINNQTGQLSFTAQIPAGFNFANYAVAVRVDEYDPNTGEYKGSIHRDVQFIVLDSCDNKAPVDPIGITNFTGQGQLLDSNTIEVCFGQDFDFDLIYYDYDTAGNLSTDSVIATCNIDQILPGATWTSSGTNPDTVHISWTAVPTNLRFVPFNVTIEDDFCPVTGFNIYSYVVRITPSTFLGPDTAMCELDTIQLNANGGDTFYWSVLSGDPIQVGTNFGCVQCKDPWIHPSQTTTYVVESNLSATCGNRDTITVEVFDKFPIDLSTLHGGTVSDRVYCSNDPIDTLISVTPGGTFLGSGIVNTAEGAFAPDVLDPGVGKDTTVKIVYIVQGVCPNTDTIALRIKGNPDARVATEGPFCENSTSEQLAGVMSGGVWSSSIAGNPTPEGVLDPSAFTPPDTVLVYHTVDDSGCVNMDSAFIRIIDQYNSAIDSLPKICAGESVLIHLNNYEGDPFGSWSGDDVFEEPLGSGEYYFNTADLRAGSYNVTYSIDVNSSCGSETTEPLIINPLPDARIFGADSVYCDWIDTTVQLETASPNGIWGGSMNELHDGLFVPKRIGEGVYSISYELYDTVTTCYNKEIVEVRIARTPVRPKLFGGGPYCQGTYLENVRADGLLTNTFKWFGVDPVTRDSLLLGAGNPFNYGELVDMPTIIYGTQVSEYGCESATSKLIIEVLPSPNALFEADSTSGTVPMEVTFDNQSTASENDTVGGQLFYEWTFGPFGSSTDEDVQFTFEEIGSYAVVLVADNGVCTDSHTVVINLDRLVKFYVPNVFTPNGDNTNDEFKWKIEGIEDFRMTVYNRWGTKVFQTDDLDEYWDGGKEPQGTYFYVVTGTERTLDQEAVEYRGDVTLLRDPNSKK